MCLDAVYYLSGKARLGELGPGLPSKRLGLGASPPKAGSFPRLGTGERRVLTAQRPALT